MLELIDLPAEVLQNILSYVLLVDQGPGRFLSEWDTRGNQLYVSHALSKSSTGSFTQDIAKGIYETTNGYHDVRYHETQVNFLVDDFCRKEALRSVSLTCKHLYSHTLNIMWKVVELKRYSDTSGTVSRFVASPDLANHVRSLSFVDRQFHCPKRDLVDEETFDAEQCVFQWKAELAKDDSQTALDNIASQFVSLPAKIRMSMVLDLLPELRAIKIFGKPRFVDAFNIPPDQPAPACLHNLREVSIISRYSIKKDTPTVDVTYLLPLFQLPSIRTLYLNGIKFEEDSKAPGQEDSDFMLEIEPFAHHFGSSSVTEIILDHCYVGAKSFSFIAGMPLALERFTHIQALMRTVNDPDHGCCLSAEWAATALDYYGQSLSLKSISMRGTHNNIVVVGGKPPLRMWRDFESLETLSLSQNITFPANGGLVELKDALPPNLVDLTLVIDSGVRGLNWHMYRSASETFAPQLKELFEIAPIRYRKLRSVRFDVVDRPMRPHSCGIFNPNQVEEVLKAALQAGFVFDYDTKTFVKDPDAAKEEYQQRYIDPSQRRLLGQDDQAFNEPAGKISS